MEYNPVENIRDIAADLIGPWVSCEQADVAALVDELLSLEQAVEWKVRWNMLEGDGDASQDRAR